MDETLSIIVHACELAKKLDTNLPNLANHPNLLSKSCEEVVILFETAIRRLNSSNTNPSASSHSPPLMIFQDPSASERPVPSEAADAAVQEWLSSSYTQAMDLFLQSQFQSPSKDPLLFSKSTSAMGSKEIGSMSQLIPGASSSDHHHMKKILELGSKEKGISFGGDTEGSSLSRSTGGGGGADLQMAEGADQSAHRSPVAHRSSRKRKDGVDKRTVRVAAPKIGNTEIPPDDGFTWRKYGQKEILGSMFPRGYFRCTHKNFYGCEAKKQVQRLDENPNIFAVTYYGQHTCHLSSSAPSAFPAEPPSNVSVLDQPPPPLLPSSTTTTTTTTTTNIAPSWPTSIEMEATSTGESSKSHVFPADDLQLPIYYYKDFIGTRSSGGGGGSGGAGPSSQPGRDTNKEGDCPVLDLADVMFNSGSSSNSMDSIFPSVPDNK